MREIELELPYGGKLKFKGCLLAHECFDFNHGESIKHLKLYEAERSSYVCEEYYHKEILDQTKQEPYGLRVAFLKCHHDVIRFFGFCENAHKIYKMMGWKRYSRVYWSKTFNVFELKEK